MNTLDLQEFYKTPLGDILQVQLQKLIDSLWPDFSNDDLTVDIGYGYPVPFMQNEHDKSVVLFPSHMGAIVWPETSSRSVLMEESLWPLGDESVDRLLIVHGLEYALNPAVLLSECYRVLKKEGELLTITTNRRSLWARFDKTPLGYGQPYTMTQLRKRLEASHFSPQKSKRGLYTPPLNHDLWISCSSLFEQSGQYVIPKLSGFVAILSTKEDLLANVQTNLKQKRLFVPFQTAQLQDA